MEGSWKTVPDLDQRNRSGRLQERAKDDGNEKERSNRTDNRDLHCLLFVYLVFETAFALDSINLRTTLNLCRYTRNIYIYIY